MNELIARIAELLEEKCSGLQHAQHDPNPLSASSASAQHVKAA